MTRSRTLLDTSALTFYLASALGTGRAAAGRLGAEYDLLVAPQCLYEFYAVATRPAENRGGFGLSTNQAIRAIEKFRTDLQLLNDPEGLFETWSDLVIRHNVSGRATHDARLAAFALAHGISRIATRDRGAFSRFGLEEIEP